jgi:hypothetical protein
VAATESHLTPIATSILGQGRRPRRAAGNGNKKGLSTRIALAEKFFVFANCNSALAEKFIAVANCNVALAEKFIAVAKRNVALAEKFVAFANCKIALAEKFVAFANCKIALAAKFVAFANCKIALAEKFVAFANCNIALAGTMRVSGGLICRYPRESKQQEPPYFAHPFLDAIDCTQCVIPQPKRRSVYCSGGLPAMRNNQLVQTGRTQTPPSAMLLSR